MPGEAGTVKPAPWEGGIKFSESHLHARSCFRPTPTLTHLPFTSAATSRLSAMRVLGTTCSLSWLPHALALSPQRS